MVIVGAGVGGLACAVDLAAGGARVVVLERAPASGGKARSVLAGGQAIDGGPTVFTMPWVFDELFDRAGRSFRSAVTLEQDEVLARHAWRDGTRLDLFADPGRSADAIGRVFGLGEARAYRAFCEDTRRIFAIAKEPFLESQRLTLLGIVGRFGAAGLATLAKLDSHRSMAESLRRRFGEPRLRQLFGRYATYVGSSPFEAPATLNLIAHVEEKGVYRARGGMRALVRALEDLAVELGVTIRHDTEVDRIVVEGGRVRGVAARGDFTRADAVVFNGDVSALGSGLLGREAARGTSPTAPDARSLSAVTWAMVARAEGMPLVHHNVVFSDDYPAEFDALLKARRVPAEPTVYVCAQDRADAEGSPAEERLLVLVNAPPTGEEPGRWSTGERERCTRVMERMLSQAGVSLAPTATVQTTPVEFHRLFPATGGALYGPRSKGSRSVLARVGAATKIPGLYLAGGSVHPGAGVPMSAMSGCLAALRIRGDRASTARSRMAAILGTTSTG